MYIKKNHPFFQFGEVLILNVFMRKYLVFIRVMGIRSKIKNTLKKVGKNG